MARFSWQHRGTLKRHRMHTQIAAAAVMLGVEERHADDETWWGPAYDCGNDCDMCIPDWRERDELRQQLVREAPAFTLADRLLAQVGLVLRQLPA